MNRGIGFSDHNVRMVSCGSTNSADTWEGFEENIVLLDLIPQLNHGDVFEGFCMHEGRLGPQQSSLHGS